MVVPQRGGGMELLVKGLVGDTSPNRGDEHARNGHDGEDHPPLIGNIPQRVLRVVHGGVEHTSQCAGDRAVDDGGGGDAQA